MSFRKAGEDLLISQSAISHHIHRLEQDLGIKLFVREARGIRFTAAGQQYFDGISDAFERISKATTALDAGTSGRSKRLRVSLLPSFAANWLVPRLARWRVEHPDIELELDPTLRLVDIARGEADVAIRYGNGSWQDVESHLALRERLSPVLSPALRKALPERPTHSDVLKLPLLLNVRPTDWEIWARATKVPLDGASTLQLTDYNIVIQAALDGQGIAMGRMLLVQDRLEAGALVQPFKRLLSSAQLGYWVLTKPGRRSEAAQIFIDWMWSQRPA
jgi:LysR family glycine cleavage system transcriptional activator